MNTYIIELQSDTPPRVFIGDSVAGGRVVIPHFAVIEWHGLPFYAMKFDEIDSDRVIKSDRLHSDTRWHLFEFDETQASVVK